MCQAEMKRNEDGSYTMTVGNKTRTFPDCLSAVNWAEEQLEERQEE
jgi:hypothetical protein